MFNQLLPILVIGIVLVFMIFLNIWNKLARKYNDKILINSICRNCKCILGKDSIDKSRMEWEKEIQKIKTESKIGTIRFRDMELICPNCGTKNKESELYKIYRKREKRKNI
jgi:hypothetical protein